MPADDATQAENTISSDYIAPPHPKMLVLACCLAGVTKSLEPHFWDFYPPHTAPFGAGWTEIKILSSIWGVILVVMIIGGGMLGDFFGRRRFLLIGLATTLAANAVAIIAISTPFHIVTHLTTSSAAAVVLPLALAPLYIFYRGRERVMAFAWYVVLTSVAGVLASSIADLGIRFFGWRGAYYSPLLIGAIALVLIYRNLPESHVRGERHLDAVVYAGWALVVLAVVFGIVQWGFVGEWAGILLITLTVAGGFGIALVMWWDINTPGNLFRNTTIQTRDMTLLIMIGVLIQLVLMGFFIPTYSYFNVVKGYSLVIRTLALLPILVGMLLSTRLVPRLWKLRRVSRVTAAGLVITGVAIGMMAVSPSTMPYLVQILPLAVFGFAIVATKTVWANAFFQTVIDDYIGLNAGINSATMLIGGALGSALSSQLIVAFGYDSFEAQLNALMSQARIDELFLLLTELTSYPRLAEALDPSLVGDFVWQAYVNSYAFAYGRTAWAMAGLCLIGGAAIWFFVRDGMRFTSTEVPVDRAASVFEEIPDELDLLPEELEGLVADELDDLFPEIRKEDSGGRA